MAGIATAVGVPFQPLQGTGGEISETGFLLLDDGVSGDFFLLDDGISGDKLIINS